MKSGLLKIKPSRKDYSLLHSFGATIFDTKGLPDNFSIYDGRLIPNQDVPDVRFNIPALPYGCTGESQSFICGLEDGAIYNPKDLYDHTPPSIDGQGRDIRDSLQTTIDYGLTDAQGATGNKRAAYFNCYGSGAIDDFDAVRIALWINQSEKRGVSVGSWWYPEFETVGKDGLLPTPSFNTSTATLHNHIITGWKTINGKVYLEDISWQGMDYGNKGVVYFSRELFNAIMEQPYTAAFTVTKTDGNTLLPIGYVAIVDHLVAFIRNLFKI